MVQQKTVNPLAQSLAGPQTLLMVAA